MKHPSELRESAARSPRVPAPVTPAPAPSPVPTPVTIGAAIRQARLRRGLTLQQLAEHADCAKSYLSMVESGARASPPGDELLARLESILDLATGHLVGMAHWHNTPAPIRRRVEALEGARRAAVAQLRELLGRGAPRAARDGARSPSMVLDELWRTGKLQSLVERLSGPDDARAPGTPSTSNIRTIAPGALRATSEPGASSAAGRVGVLGLTGAEIPLINSVAAGYPRGFTDLGYPARVADSYVRSPDIDDPDAFACRVVGDSMTPDYREGDIVIFSPARPIKSGMDCFVRLEPDHESTFKRIYFEDAPGAPAAAIRLQPLNAHYPARTVAREQVAGLYAAVSVTRKLG